MSQRLSLLAAALALPAAGLSLQGSSASAAEGRLAVNQIGKIQIVTVETRGPNPLKLPGRTPGAGDTPYVTNVGAGQPWHFYRTKNGLMLEWLKAHKDPDTIAIMIDGSDMILGGCNESFIMQKYEDTLQASGGGANMTMVMSAETACFPHEMDWHFRDNATWENRRKNVTNRVANLPENWLKPWTPCADKKKAPCDTVPAYRYPNWGWVMGPVKSLTPLFEYVYNQGHKKGNDNLDQARAQWWMLWHPDRITLDYTGSLVLSIHQMAYGRPDHHAPIELRKDWHGHPWVHNKILNQPCCFAHGNGDGEGLVTRMMRKMDNMMNEPASADLENKSSS